MKRTFRLVCAAMAVASFAPCPGVAQDGAGRILGRVLDAGSGKVLSGAQVYVGEGGAGALAGVDGRYVLAGVRAGTVEVTAQLIGYSTKTVTGVSVEANQVTALDITLEESSVALEGIVVEASRERGSQAFLLDQRRIAPAMVESVGAQEISRRPDSDAADVAQRLTGVTVTDGKYVFVRGLGERYSQTTLNGSSLPSPEPEREVVPLDLFPSGFLESLETQKSYTPDLPADFSGGSVKIQTRDFPSRFVVRFGVSSSFNTKSQFQDGFLAYPGGGRDFLGFDDGTRGEPDVVRQIMGDVTTGERLPTDPTQLVQIGEALRGSGRGFAPIPESTPLNRSFNLSVGGRDDVLDRGELGYFLAGTYSDEYSIHDDEVERKWTVSSFDPAISGDDPLANVDYAFQRGSRAITWGTIANVTFKPNPDQKVSLRTTVNVNTEDEARVYQGLNSEDIGGIVKSDRLRFVSRLMLWSQLSGEHALFGGSRLEWRATAARAGRDEPMLRESVYLQSDGVFRLHNIGESGRYFWSDLTDDDLSGALDWTLPFGFLGNDASLKLGGEYRTRSRDFAARRLNWKFLGGVIEDLDQALATATIVPNARRIGELSIDEVVEPGDLYDAQDDREAGYLLLDLPMTDRLQAIVGARVEHYALGLHSRGHTLSDLDQTDVAPSVNLVYSLGDAVNLRGAVSRTLDRPEFRELAPFQFTEATSLRQVFGNENLVPAEIVSSDLRLDWFPRPGEMLSIGGFVKDLTNPIEQVFVAAASAAYSFQNAKDARIYGVEFDAQMGLERLSPALRDYGAQLNYSKIHSKVNVRQGEAGFEPTNLTRPLEGQAPYVLNAGLNWASPTTGVEAGLFFNRFGPRLTAAGGLGIPDIYERPRNALDATLGFPLPGGATAKIKGNNLLDAQYLFEQSTNGVTLVQRQYSVGRTFSVGLSWEF
jgi:hypothetical protein